MKLFLIFLFSTFIQSLYSQGIPYNQEFHINTVTDGSQYKPKVVSLSNGNFIVCWVTYIENKRTAYGQLFSSDTTKIGNEFKINTSYYFNFFN